MIGRIFTAEGELQESMLMFIACGWIITAFGRDNPGIPGIIARIYIL